MYECDTANKTFTALNIAESSVFRFEVHYVPQTITEKLTCNLQH